MQQEATDRANRKYWDLPCGSVYAEQMGIADLSPESLAKFDAWYFGFYPYLLDYIRPPSWSGKRVLEVGLGYGSVAQALATAGCLYQGLDIALGPVSVVNHRMRLLAQPQRACQGSILAAPFEDETFDAIVAIGCFHHTGRTQQAIDEAYRLLRPGGQLVFMVYYAYSYRRWTKARGATVRHLLRSFRPSTTILAGEHQDRASYDTNQEGDAAPHTEFFGRREIRRMCGRFSTCEIALENIAQEFPFTCFSRERLLHTIWPRQFGLDLYTIATK